MTDSASSRQQIEALVTKFKQGYDTYLKADYGEMNVRTEFIDPFFEALGWSMSDSREVYREARQKVEKRAHDAVKSGRPDYEFLPNTSVRFYVEAKKPSVNLREDNRPAYQIRSYGWSADMPVCVLTDFEELVIYNTRLRPNETDKADYALLRRYPYTDYAANWQEITDLLSKTAVQQGSLIHLLEAAKIAGSVRVDDAFLQDMELWRQYLAKDLYLHNPTLNKRQLNLMVQLLLDRLIFLRMCEDRGIERFGQLADANTSQNIYAQLLLLFRQADNRYNSGLFHFREEKGRSSEPDDLSLNLILPNDTLKPILETLYFPRSPYKFDVMPTEILGQAYERFLGKVIEIQGTTITIEEKPDVRKAGGVYYTPSYIVDAIVEKTVGHWLKDKSLAQADALRIIDPACGSGSFLIGAYQYLLTWYADQYRQNEQHALNNGDLRFDVLQKTALTVAAKKRILTQHLYGVDLDQQAVEVTKLSLVLKLLEGETDQTTSAPKQMTLQLARILPDLDLNVQWGNSLIGIDFYRDKMIAMFEAEDLYRVKVFDWGQAFNPIMERGGFDIVIGNPPYIRLQTLKETAPDTLPYLKTHYKTTARGNYDLYIPFVEKGLQLLNATGRLGYILPHKFFNAKYGEPLRGLVAQGKHLADVVHFGDIQIFKGATTYTCLLFLDKAARETFQFQRVTDLTVWQNDNLDIVNASAVIATEAATKKEWDFVAGSTADVISRLKTFPIKLANIAKPFVGLQTSADPVFLFEKYRNDTGNTIEVFSKALKQWVTLEKDLLKRVIRSGKIAPYRAEMSAYVLFPYYLASKATLINAADMEQKYPLSWQYLQANQELLSKREHGKFAKTGWYQLYPKNLNLWEKDKILMPYMVTRLSAYLDTQNHYFVNVTTGGFGLRFDPSQGSLAYFTGLLNSKLLSFYFKSMHSNFRSGYFGANKQFLDRLPIHPIDFTNPAEKAAHDRIVAHVETLLKLMPQQDGLSREALRIIKAQISTAETAIDHEVYALYGITKSERAIIEATEGA